MILAINRALENSRMKREEGEKGFTLIELLVVVVIIGILAAIAIPVFLNQREGAWRSSVESDLKNAATAVETYGAQNNGSFSGMTSTGPFTAAGNGTATNELGDGVRLTVSEDNNITITVSPTGTTYTILGTNDNLGTTTSVTWDSQTGGLGDWT